MVQFFLQHQNEIFSILGSLVTIACPAYAIHVHALRKLSQEVGKFINDLPLNNQALQAQAVKNKQSKVAKVIANYTD